jgi:tetratricopeptide (TPR) repeat protein
MVPVMGIIPINALYLEHWLYMSIIGIIITGLFIFSSINNLFIKKILTIFYILFLIIISIRTFIRNNDWIDPIKFYQNEIKYSPNNARIHNNLAMYYAETGNAEKAIEYYKKAININDIYPQTHHNLANLYLNAEKYDMAYSEYVKAIFIDHNFIYSYAQLAELYQKINKKDKYDATIMLLNKYQNNQQISDEDIKKHSAKLILESH